MNERFNNLFNIIFQICLFILALFIPLLFWGFTTEYYETPKFLLLAVVSAILLILWILRCLIMGKIIIWRTPLDLSLILLLLASLVSTFFAASRTVAIFGNFPRIHGGTATLVVYIIFYFVLVAGLAHYPAIKQNRLIKQTLNLLLLAGVILSVLSLLSFWGQHLLPFSWTQTLNFTPTGSNFSTAALLSLLLPFPLLALLPQKGAMSLNTSKPKSAEKSNSSLGKFLARQIILVLSQASSVVMVTLFLAVIVLTQSLASTTAAVVVLIIVLLMTPKESLKRILILLALPLAVSISLFVLSSFPLGGNKNLLYSQSQQVPREIQLPFLASWKTSISAFGDTPLWGTGPGSYLANFTFYKSADFNNFKYWNGRFDQAFNEYLQYLATLGILGFAALVFFTVTLLSLAFKTLKQQEKLNSSLALSVIALFTILFLHASTLPIEVLGILVITTFLIATKGVVEKVQVGVTANRSLKQSTDQTFQFNILPGVLITFTLILLGSFFYFTGKFVIADYRHRLALNEVAAGKALNAYNDLIIAERLNPYIDLYRTDLAQTNFALANAIALAKAPSESNPEGQLTDQDKQNIQSLLSQAINEGKTATLLNPQNSGNWEILGSIYRQMSGVAQNALTFSLDSYGRAIQRDPMNPLLRLTVGGIYYSVKNYDLAVRFFSDSASLKPDFASGYYNLAIALRDKGDLNQAVSIAEKAVSLLDPQHPDYQTASNLLAELKAKVATGSAKKAAGEETTAPAAKTSSALQNKKLPKVLDLPKPEKIATPEAVKKQTPEE